MSDFRSTVHVPATSFPMRGDLLNRQEEILARWQAQDLYRAILEDRRDAQPFIIHDGPPYASGQVHVGIGLNKILKDVVAKFHSMRHRRVPFVPGWDCHGLPIEREVMKSLGDRARELSPIEIRRLCEEKRSATSPNRMAVWARAVARHDRERGRTLSVTRARPGLLLTEIPTR